MTASVAIKEVRKQRGIFEKEPDSGVWWVRYADASGRIRREKGGSKGAANRLLHKRKTQVAERKKLPENFRTVVRVKNLAAAVERDYRVNNRKSFDALQRRLEKHILPFFGSYSANDLTTADIDKYVDKRKLEGAQNATINRELAVLKRMYRLALQSTPPQVDRVPAMARLQENPPRSGFVEEAQYNILAAHASESWLRALLLTAYTFGFRKSELLGLRVKQIDLLNKKIWLKAGSTKNNEGRTVTMTAELVTVLSLCVFQKDAEDFVFTRKDGLPVLDFRGTWYDLCQRAGLGKFVKVDGTVVWQGLTFHDLRRSAVRNMVRRDVSERVAMKISGHKTRSVFDRYNITSETDIDEAAAKIAAGRRHEPTYETDTPTSTDANRASAAALTETEKAQFLQ